MSWSEETIRNMMLNPVHTGVGPYPALIDEATWVRTFARLVEEIGPEEVARRVLANLRAAFPLGTTVP